MQYTLKQNIWFGDEPALIELPDDWDVEFHEVPADNLPILSQEQIREKINHPYGMKTLRELACGKQKACIVFDDLTRSTPCQSLAAVILEELHAGGLGVDNIIFLCALGTHGTQTRVDFVKKLGEEIVGTYRVYNHNCYDNCVNIGTTQNGVPVAINREFMECDLKIGIGQIIPHLYNGFGGGGKMFFPGIASIDTVQQNHVTGINALRTHPKGIAGTMGYLSNSGMRTEIEEMTKMLGEVFKVDCLLNTSQGIVDVYAGNPIDEYYAGVEKAKDIYGTNIPDNKDVVIVNANAKASEAGIAVSFGSCGLNKDHGDLVVVNFSQMGQMPHYLLGVFGKESAGRLRKNGHGPRMAGKGRTIYYSPYREGMIDQYICEPNHFVQATTWQQVMDLLREKHGVGTRVSILADGTMQYYLGGE